MQASTVDKPIIQVGKKRFIELSMACEKKIVMDINSKFCKESTSSKLGFSIGCFLISVKHLITSFNLEMTVKNSA